MNFSKHSSNKKLRSLNSTNKKVTTLLGTSFVRLLVFSIVLLGVLGASAGLGLANAIFDSAPDVDFEEMIPEGYTSFIMDQNGNVVQELSIGDANRIYVEIDQIPEHVQNAFIAIEDARFYEHNGIDMRGIFRAIFVNLREGSISEGASTLTQQVIKNNVLSTEKSFQRKIQEQYLAVQAEKILSKEEILELYLNTAALGRGTHGVQAASKRYFNKDINELNLAEAAVIAGITQLPTTYDPVINPDNNREKQLIILRYMEEQGMITPSERAAAEAEDVYAKIQVVNQAFEENSDYSYFVDETIRRVADDLEERKGYLANQATNLIYRGGLSIYITQDLGMQEILDTAFLDEENFPSFEDDYNAYLQYTLSVETSEGVQHHYEEEVLQSDDEAMAYMETLKAEWVSEGDTILAENYQIIPQPQAAMIIMDYYTGHVKAMVSGRGEKVGNNIFDRTTQAKRQPGSTFKVLAAYLPAIDSMGYTLADVFDDAPYTVDVPGSGPYTPKNWYDHQDYNYWGLSTVREGIQWSMNILAVKTMFDIGIDTGFAYLQDLGFTTLLEKEVRNGQVFTDKVISLPLGGVTDGVPLIELTAAYGAIANQGVYVEPIFYTKVLNHDGSILLLNEPETRTVMKETTAFLLTSAMEDVVNSGTATPARFDNMHIAGKTGTTSDSKDLAFIGYTPYYVAGIWMGHDQPEKMVHNYAYHKLLWSNVMGQIHEGLEDRPFVRPDGIVTAAICTESGKLAVEGLCDNDPRGSQVRYEYFAAGTAPTEYCDVHVKATVCGDTFLFPSEFCPDEALIERVFIARREPLNPESWDPADPPRIRDYQYELPYTMENEYCTYHTGETTPTTGGSVIYDEFGNPVFIPSLDNGGLEPAAPSQDEDVPTIPISLDED